MGRVLRVLALSAALFLILSGASRALGEPVSVDGLCREKNLTEWQCNMVKAEMSRNNWKLVDADGEDEPPETEQAQEEKEVAETAVEKEDGAMAPGKDGRRGAQKPVLEKALRPAESKKGERSLFDRYVEGVAPGEFKGGLRPFGYNVFANASQKRGARNIPVAEDYVLGPGDEVVLFMWGRINGRHTLAVSRDGAILVPDIGPFTVAGLTFREMTGLLKKQARDMIGTEINVTMGRLRSIQVFVLGEVKNPGPYTVTAMSTITDAVIASGGPSGIGSLRSVRLKRGGVEVAEMDFYDLFLRGDKSKDLRVRDGDVVFVPTAGPLVGVAGNVRRPAVYELKGPAGLETVLGLAGGVTPAAYTQQIQVERVEGNRRRIVVDINAEDKGLEGFVLQDADLVKIFSVFDRDMNAVFIEGNVKRPGKVEHKPGMRLSAVIKGPDDLLDETFLDYGLVKRISRPTGEARLIPFDLGRLIEGDAREDMELQPKDTVFVFSKWLFRDRPKASIEGEVRVETSAGLPALPESVDIVALGRKKASFDPAKGLLTFKGVMTESEREELLGLLKVDALKSAPQGGVSAKPDERPVPQGVRAIKLSPSPPLPPAARPSKDAVDGEEKEARQPAPVAAQEPEDAYRDAVNRLFVESNGKGVIEIEKDMRIKDMVLLAGGLSRDAMLGQSELYRTDRLTNRVTLLRFNLGKAMEGDPGHNLPLRDLDRVVVHSVHETEPGRFVSVEGDVGRPGRYPLAEGMRVSDLVFAAGGALESAYLDEAELASRPEQDGGPAAIIRRIDAAKALAKDPSEDAELRPGDVLFIKRIPDWGQERFVTLEGEVRFPGRYLIKKGERLSSVIERAGGFTARAYLKGAVFSRESVRALQQRNLDDAIDRLEKRMIFETSENIQKSVSADTARQEEAATEQRRQLIEKMRQTKAAGRMVVKLDDPEALKDSAYDITLEDGDRLAVPWRYSVLNVSGAVVNPTSFIYEPGTSISDYIKKSGGATESADMKKAYVIKVDGSAMSAQNLSRWKAVDWDEETRSWDFGSAYSRLDPGDTIVVPEKTDKVAWMREIKDLTQILYQIAVTAGVIIVAF